MATISLGGTRRSWLQRVGRWLQPAVGTAPARPVGQLSVRSINGSNPYVGEIALFAGAYAPSGWAFCDGRLLSVSEYDTLFLLIGTTYGGDGEYTFALPDLRGRVSMHAGTSSSSGSTYALGESLGVEEVVLTTQQLRTHTHPVPVSTQPGTTASPVGAVPALAGSGSAQYTPNTGSLATQPTQMLAAVGGSSAHNNMQPYLTVNYIISLFGIFPTSS
jgi:microcystin-dependent protein